MTAAVPSPSDAVPASPDESSVDPAPLRDVATVNPNAVAVTSDASPLPSSGGAVVYVVKSGDTLTALSHRFKCSLDELAQLNGKTVKALSRLTIGQRLKVPVASDR